MTKNPMKAMKDMTMGIFVAFRVGQLAKLKPASVAEGLNVGSLVA
jgi:hypothetical protein